MLITLQDVEVILGLPIDGEILVGSIVGGEGFGGLCVRSCLVLKFWRMTKKTLVGQRILINRLVERIAEPLLYDATQIQIHQYVRCYILALVRDKIFMDKSGDRVYLMFLEFLRNLCDLPSIVGVVVSWHGCTKSCVGQAIKVNYRFVGCCNWSSIGHGQGYHSCARR